MHVSLWTKPVKLRRARSRFLSLIHVVITSRFIASISKDFLVQSTIDPRDYPCRLFVRPMWTNHNNARVIVFLWIWFFSSVSIDLTFVLAERTRSGTKKNRIDHEFYCWAGKFKKLKSNLSRISLAENPGILPASAVFSN